MIDIKESDLVEGLFWDDDKKLGEHARLLCKKPFGNYPFFSIDNVGCVATWKNFELKKEPEYVPWESIDEIPEEFWNGWVKRIYDGTASRVLGLNNEGCIVFAFKMPDGLSPTYYSFALLGSFVWSTTFNGEYNPCGKLKE